MQDIHANTSFTYKNAFAGNNYPDDKVYPINLEFIYDIHIWISKDPMADYINEASKILEKLDDVWHKYSDGNYVSVDSTDTIKPTIKREVIHLLTTRTNTGTGGIAYLDVMYLKKIFE